MKRRSTWFAAALLACLAGCVTVQEQVEAPSEDAGAEASVAASAGWREPAAEFPSVTLNQGHGVLNDTVRLVGEQFGGGLVVMNGIGELAVPPMDLRQAPYESFVNQLAQAVDLRVARLPRYYFIHANGYEMLPDLRLDAGLDPAHAQIRTSVAIGDKTALFDALALLSYSLDTTLVADNGLAGSRCGECVFTDAPLPAVLEGLLMSARVLPGAFYTVSTPGYIFLGTRGNPPPSPALHGAAGLPAAQRALLDEEVSIILPERPGGANSLPFRSRPSKLSDVLESLSHQLGLPVAAERRMADFPVNPCVLQGVTRAEALDLIIAQWFAPGFGYEMRGNGILLRQVP